MIVLNKALAEVQWALDKAYKVAVHNRGITDWSREKPEMKNIITHEQIEIAKMILGRMKDD